MTIDPCGWNNIPGFKVCSEEGLLLGWFYHKEDAELFVKAKERKAKQDDWNDYFGIDYWTEKPNEFPSPDFTAIAKDLQKRLELHQAMKNLLTTNKISFDVAGTDFVPEPLPEPTIVKRDV